MVTTAAAVMAPRGYFRLHPLQAAGFRMIGSNRSPTNLKLNLKRSQHFLRSLNRTPSK